MVTKRLGGIAKGFAIVGGLVLTGIYQASDTKQHGHPLTGRRPSTPVKYDLLMSLNSGQSRRA